jgi:hypothetical protein
MVSIRFKNEGDGPSEDWEQGIECPSPRPSPRRTGRGSGEGWLSNILTVLDSPTGGGPLPLSFWAKVSTQAGEGARRSVPKAQVTIAQRFSVGYGAQRQQVPKGRLTKAPGFSRPFGTQAHWTWVPNAEALGYSQGPLRGRPPRRRQTHTRPGLGGATPLASWAPQRSCFGTGAEADRSRSGGGVHRLTEAR